MTPAALIQGLRDQAWHKAREIRNDVWAERALHPVTPGSSVDSLIWAVGDVKLAWAAFLEAVSGWVQ